MSNNFTRHDCPKNVPVRGLSLAFLTPRTSWHSLVALECAFFTNNARGFATGRLIFSAQTFQATGRTNHSSSCLIWSNATFLARTAPKIDLKRAWRTGGPWCWYNCHSHQKHASPILSRHHWWNVLTFWKNGAQLNRDWPGNEFSIVRKTNLDGSENQKCNKILF
jgi:hypothetical protein